MDESATTADDPGRSLHERLLAGDPLASADVAEHYLPLVVTRLRRVNPSIRDPHLIEMAAIDAIFSYIRRPQQYDPDRLPLERYLDMSASGDLKNALQAETRRARRSTSLDSDTATAVEVSQRAGNDSVEEQVLKRLGQSQPNGISHQEALWMVAREFPNPADRQILILMLENERATRTYAPLLNVEGLPVEEQRREVKRAKDRIGKRLQRLRARLNGGVGQPR